MDEVSDARKLVRAHGLQQAREIGDGRFIDVRPQHEAQATYVHRVRWVTERAAQQSDTIAQPRIIWAGSPPIVGQASSAESPRSPDSLTGHPDTLQGVAG